MGTPVSYPDADPSAAEALEKLWELKVNWLLPPHLHLCGDRDRD